MNFLKILPIFLTLLSVNFIYAKPSKEDLKADSLTAEAKVNFTIKEPEIIDFNGKKYKIFIAESKNFTQTSTTKAFYLLDANKHFPMLLNALQNDILKMKDHFIIVGIGYDVELGYDIVQRKRDYTPKIKGKNFENGSGGEEEFFIFIEQKLLPKIKQSYPNLTEQALFGHSFGGLFTLNALLNHQLIFDSYYIASPSLWWGESEFVPKQISFKKCPNILILKGGSEKNHRQGKINLQEMIARITRHCEVELKEFKSQSHGSVIPFALVFAFKNFVK